MPKIFNRGSSNSEEKNPSQAKNNTNTSLTGGKKESKVVSVARNVAAAFALKKGSVPVGEQARPRKERTEYGTFKLH